MTTTTISLSDDRLARLRQLAFTTHRSLDDVVGEAVDTYLAGHMPAAPTRITEPANDIAEDEWQARFQAVTDHIRQAGPTDLTPDEIEREITLAREEARRIVSD